MSEELVARQIAAVHRVFDNSARTMVEIDILAQTALHVLSTSHLPTDDLAQQIQASWPGCGVTDEQATRAIQIAADAGLITETATLGDPAWAPITSDTAATDWSAAILERTRDHLAQNMSAELNRDVTGSEAEGWFVIVREAVAAAIREAHSGAYTGDVRRVGNHLLPRNYDRDALDAVINEAATANEYKPILKALAVEALDPAGTFGTELASHLATGYMLQAFLAERDRAPVVASVGTLTHEWLVPDTPVLLGILGIGPTADALNNTLTAARHAGMNIVILEPTLQELDRLLTGAEQSGVAEIERAIANGASPVALRQYSDDGVIHNWLSHHDPEHHADLSMTWVQFRRKAANLQQQAQDTWGAAIRRIPHRADMEFQSLNDHCASALQDEVQRRLEGRPGVQARRPESIRHDAQMMAFVLTRRHTRAASDRLWPGAWILTPDTHMSPAADRLQLQRTPLTLTSPELAALLSKFTQPTEIRTLARAASTLLADQTMMDVASYYPVETAVQIALALAQDPTSTPMESRTVQLSFAGLDSGTGDNTDPAVALLARRERHRRALDQAGQQRLAQQLEDSSAKHEAAKTRAETLQEQLDDAQRKVLEQERDHAVELADANRELNEQQKQREDDEVRARRTTVTYSLTIALLLGAALLWLLDLPIGAAATLLAGAVLPRSTREWRNKQDKDTWSVFWPLALEIFIVADFIARWRS